MSEQSCYGGQNEPLSLIQPRAPEPLPDEEVMYVPDNNLSAPYGQHEIQGASLPSTTLPITNATRREDRSYQDKTQQTPQPLSLDSDATEHEESAVDHSSQNSGHIERISEKLQHPNQESEIQSIMDQFNDEANGPKEEEIMSPRRELASPILSNPMQFPPRRSSLEPLTSPPNKPLLSDGTQESFNSKGQGNSASSQVQSYKFPENQVPLAPVTAAPARHTILSESNLTPIAPDPASPQPRAPYPRPGIEPDLPFDFHRFLEQLRHRTADPVAKFLRSFLMEFGKKQWMVHEQVKIVGDFLDFITNKMVQCEVWQGISDAEFDNAKEGMEKLVMNRLYVQTFSPAIPPPPNLSAHTGKRKNIDKILGGTRRGQHQEDIERDELLAEKERIYGWIQEKHLDIPDLGDNGRRLMHLAQQELLKIKNYRAPRDKVICVLNACKVIFGFLKNASTSDTSADAFIPLLIYVILKASPEHLVSNVQYIFRFRNQDKLGGEAGYYLSSLMGAIQFIENLDRTSLTVSDEDFEHNVELAVSRITERRRNQASDSTDPTQVSEKSSLSIPQITRQDMVESDRLLPNRKDPMYPSNGQSYSSQNDSDGNPVAGLLRNIQRPLSNIGRMFSDQQPSAQRSTNPPYSANSDLPPRRLSPAIFHPPRQSEDDERPESESKVSGPSLQTQNCTAAQTAAARQASAEAAEAQQIQAAEHSNVVKLVSRALSLGVG